MLQNENTPNIHNINCDWNKYPMVSIKDYYSNNFNDIMISEHFIFILQLPHDCLGYILLGNLITN